MESFPSRISSNWDTVNNPLPICNIVPVRSPTIPLKKPVCPDPEITIRFLLHPLTFKYVTPEMIYLGIYVSKNS